MCLSPPHPLSLSLSLSFIPCLSLSLPLHLSLPHFLSLTTFFHSTQSLYAVTDTQSDTQSLILAQELQGTSTIGSVHLKEPPKDPLTNIRFDTTTDSLDTILVTYCDSQGQQSSHTQARTHLHTYINTHARARARTHSYIHIHIVSVRVF